MIAIRPRSLPIAVSPVVVGAALTWERTGELPALLFVLALLVSVLMQVITNLQNDVGYTLRGAERAGNRVGLPRATSSGLLSAAQVRRAIVGAIGLALALGLPIVAARGWPAVLMGSASIVAALSYMGGPRPIAYTPYGELVVFVFFGLVAVAGTDYVLSGSLGPATGWAGATLGALAAAVLVINNHRDTEHDHSVGRRTFAVVHGPAASRALLGVLLLAPFAALPVIALALGAALLLPALTIPSALRLWRDFRATGPGLAYNQLLFRTARLELLYALLLAGGAVLERLAR